MPSPENASDLAKFGAGESEKPASIPAKRPEKEVAAKKKPRQFRSRKPKDMPRRPLSAYNIFFKEQRAKLLADRQAKGTAAGGEKIGFEKMAKTIGMLWKELSAEELGRFKLLAKDDTERYRREMDAYNHELAMKGRRDREEMNRKRMEEAGMQPQAGLPTLAPTGNPAASVTLPPAPTQPQSASAQLNHLLGGSSLPTSNLQGLRGFLGGAPNRSNPLQDALLLGNLGQQQNQPTLEDQLRQHQQQQNQARLEEQLRLQQQQKQPTLEDQLRQHQQQQNQARLEEQFRQQQQPSTQALLQDQLRQNLLNRVAANPSLLASLPPTVQQQLLVQALQGGGGNDLLAGALGSLSSAPSSSTRP